jgi:hypothetical protein
MLHMALLITANFMCCSFDFYTCNCYTAGHPAAAMT